MWSRIVAAGMVLALAASAAAQPIACEACVKGDAIIDKFGVQDVRPLAGELARLPLSDALTPEQYARVIELRDRSPALLRLGAIDDADLTLVAAALCHAEAGTCTDATAHALRCLADRCTVAFPPDKHPDVPIVDETCARYIVHRRSPPFGLGLDWGNGVQRSRYPSDGRAWSFGIDARVRLRRRFGAVVRVDRSAGRDEATDADNNGNDDFSTGSITRLDVLAGPSFVLDYTKYDDTTRFLRLDLLGGYLATRSQADEDGPAAGFDLSYHLWALRAGVRVVQGFGDASSATMMLAHLGFVTGAGPEYDFGGNCGTGRGERSTRIAIGFDTPIGGYGIARELGYLGSGVGIEVLVHLSPSFDVLTRADLLLFPGDERDRVIHQAALAGLRFDHGPHGRKSNRVGWFTTGLVGYTHSAGFTPTEAGTGPIIDLSLGLGGQGSDGAAYLRLHGRFGISPDNYEYRAVFLSAGIELRLDPSRWRDRV